MRKSTQPPSLQKAPTQNIAFSILLLGVRIYIGYEWLLAGWNKLDVPTWIGSERGVAVTKFLTNALSKTVGDHPSVSAWYGWMITHIFLPNVEIISYLVVFGEILVGVALILGIFIRFATLSGIFMNFNYLFAGTVSTNPLLLLLGLFVLNGGAAAEHLSIQTLIKKIKNQIKNIPRSGLTK